VGTSEPASLLTTANLLPRHMLPWRVAFKGLIR
jgi:hypothetical protein